MKSESFCRGLVAAAILLLAIVLLRTAWMSDDAFITYRTMDNLVHGHGLRWNVGERVQSYTNPLWLFVNAAVYVFTGEIFLTGIAVSVIVSLAAVSLAAFGVARSGTLALLMVLILTFSRAFVDYATSGLENPLTHLLLAVFLLLFFRQQCSARTVFWLALAAALGTLNRMDSLLLYVPALAYAWLSLRTRRATTALIAGFLPFIAWEVFSVVYYGFPFPNTAYAKLGSGIEAHVLVEQGVYYFKNSLVRDPLTLPVVALGVASPLLLRKGRLVPLSLGIVLYLVYIVKIGGDFMSGRFFTAPLFLAVMMLTRIPVKRNPVLWAPVFVLVAWVGLTQANPPIKTTAELGRTTAGFKDAHNVCDERWFYFQTSSLLQWKRGKAMPSHKYAHDGRRYRRENKPRVVVHGSVGYRGYFGGPTVHIIDSYALADPLLARLPMKYAPKIKMGHFPRHVPAGYKRTLIAGENQIGDRDLAAYYDRLALITRGPLWSPERWAAIVKMNLGLYEHLIDRDRYRFAGMRRVSLAELNRAGPGKTRSVVSAGLHIDLGGTQQAGRLALGLGANDAYRVLFMRGEAILGVIDVGPDKTGKGGIADYPVSAAKVAPGGYTAVRVIPFPGDKNYRVGYLRLQ